MKVLFATENPAKVGKYKKKLEQKGIELLTISDLDFKLNIEESGKNALENAYIKAKSYFDKTHIPTIGMDNCLYIEELPDELQPGTNVRRVNNKRLSDSEMIEYYTGLVKKYGRLTAKWVYGMVICTDDGEKNLQWSKDHFYLLSDPCEKMNEGYPLDTISFVPEFNKYLAEVTDEDRAKSKEKDNTDDVINFIVNVVK